MLRTNQSFLVYIEQLYNSQSRKDAILLKKFRKGQKLLSQGEQAVKVLLIADGITKCYFYEKNDKEYILEFLSRGEIVGEIEAIRETPCLCNVEPITDVQAYSIDISLFKELLKRDLAFNNLLIDAFAQRIINTSSRASFQQLYTVEYSLSKLLEMQSKQGIILSKDDMAAYLGITTRSLNRALRNV